MSCPPLVSPRGMLHVLEYSPVEGEHGVLITVRIHFNHDTPDTIFLRLVIGPKAVATEVNQLTGTAFGAYELSAAAPVLDPSTVSSPKVLVTVQALTPDNAVIDSLTFGEFTYWQPGHSPTSSFSSIKRESSNEHIGEDGRPRRHSLAYMPSPTPPPGLKARQPSKTQRRLRANSLMRTKYPAPRDLSEEDLLPQSPLLSIATPLASMCKDWAGSEMRAGRRLVRFHKVQDGRKIIVSCEPINQDDYKDSDSVISCIFRQETNSFYVTSVDIIYLLERLTNDEFPVEEKNRIRRNLEGLRPTTVSKHRAGFENFFNKIMEFPDPKPRNIEKDLKVFDWNLLGAALDKILSKYSIYTSSPTDSTVSLPAEPASPLLQESQLAYPEPHEHSSLFGGKDITMAPSMAKEEPDGDSLLFLAGPDSNPNDDGTMSLHGGSDHAESVYSLSSAATPAGMKMPAGEHISFYDLGDGSTNFGSCANDFGDYAYDFRISADAYA